MSGSQGRIWIFCWSPNAQGKVRQGNLRWEASAASVGKSEGAHTRALVRFLSRLEIPALLAAPNGHRSSYAPHGQRRKEPCALAAKTAVAVLKTWLRGPESQA